MKILTIIGTRPQYVKWWALEAELRRRGVDYAVADTGQHFDPNMSAVFFDQLGLTPPKHRLEVHSLPIAHMIGTMAGKLAPIVQSEPWTKCVVIGDTASTLAGALAAARAGLPIYHVEAGVRSQNRNPEELNRVAVDHLSEKLFCPTDYAFDCAREEGLEARSIWTGDINFDCVRLVREGGLAVRPEGLDETSGSIDFMTLHRAENTVSADVLSDIFEYVNDTSGADEIIFPVHPRTRSVLDPERARIGKIRPIAPIGYLETQWLLERARHVFTDSGGVQKEAFFHGVRATLILDDTPYPELLDGGWVRLWRGEDFKDRQTIDAFGDGRAAARMVDEILA
ncbi:MAG: UDP-N-acetylglucosamine 2-epimerase [Oceanicaulis sp.]